jgi:hypothetical protein
MHFLKQWILVYFIPGKFRGQRTCHPTGLQRAASWGINLPWVLGLEQDEKIKITILMQASLHITCSCIIFFLDVDFYERVYLLK